MSNPMSTFPNGFTSVSIRGVPILNTYPNNALWVKSAATENGQGTFQRPFSTLQAAITAAEAGKGDVIVIKAGHAETISSNTALAFSKAGVQIIGLGVGGTRPTFTLDTANTTCINVTAINVGIQNCLFLANFLNIATCFNIANAQVATDFVVDGCEFRDLSVVLNFVACVKVGTTANIADGLRLTNNRVLAAILTTVPAGQTFCVTASIMDRINISGNTVIYPKTLADTACLLEAGALDLTNALIDGNYVFRPSTSTTGHLIGSSSTACSGFVSNNLVAHLDNSAGLIIPTGTKFSFFNNWSMVTGAADKSALINPVAV